MATDTDAWLMNGTKLTPETETDCSFEDSFTPFERLPDSDNYISGLENKLAKVRGDTKKSKSSQLVRDLEATRDQHLRNLMLQGERLETTETTTENGAARMNVPTVLRRICPDKQALSEEELQKLLLADELARIAAQLQAIEKEKEKEDSKKRDEKE